MITNFACYGLKVHNKALQAPGRAISAVLSHLKVIILSIITCFMNFIDREDQTANPPKTGCNFFAFIDFVDGICLIKKLCFLLVCSTYVLLGR